MAMAGIPQNFQAVSNVLANYDFVDIASGTGYINFYAGDTVDLKLLSNFTYYSNTILDTCAAEMETTATKELDLDFDIVLNRPLDLRGLGIVNVPFSIYGASAEGYIIVTLKKWNGSTETTIVTNTGTTKTNASDGPFYYMASIDLNVPLTHFKVGETIRLTVECWGKSPSKPNTQTVSVAHDPMNRATGWDASGDVPSKLLFQCPVRLNL